MNKVLCFPANGNDKVNDKDHANNIIYENVLVKTS